MEHQELNLLLALLLYSSCYFAKHNDFGLKGHGRSDPFTMILKNTVQKF